MSITRVTGLAPLVLAVACAGNPAPSGFLPSPAEAVSDVYGGWIEAGVMRVGKEDSTIAGELIAARADSVWIFPDGGHVTALATNAIRNGRLVRYHSDAGAVAGFTVVGILTTVSNGAFLIITAPLWIITGSVAASSESRAPQRDVPPLGWADLAAYARFPQGLPPGIDLEEIRPKPGAGTAPSANP
jgi:hypothetical protein